MVCREAGKIPKPMQYVFLAAILLIAVFFRFYHLTTLPPGLGPDEAMNGNNAVEAVETNHLQMFYTEDNGREGLYVDLVALLLRHWPIYEPWVIRAPAAIAGVLTVLGLYLLVSELFGVGEGLIAAFLLSTSTWHITFSRQGLRAILAPLLLLWSMWVMIYAFCEFPKLRTAPRSSNRWWYVVVAGFLYGLGFYTYIAYRITPLLVVLLIASFSKRSTGFWGKMAVFLAVTLMTVWPLGWYFYSHPEAFVGRASQISIMNSPNPTRAFLTNLGKEALMFNLQGDRKQNFNGAPELFLPVGILFLLGLGACLAALVRFGCKSEPMSPPLSPC